MRIRVIIISILIATSLGACTAMRNDLARGLEYGTEAKALTRKVDERRPAGKKPSGINAFLWRASLDQVASIPLVTADPSLGLIVTDWYSAPGNPDDRTKLKIEVLDGDLRPDTLRVSIARQVKQEGGWANTPSLASAARILEETILVRARDLK